MRNAWPQQCWKSCANGSNLLRYASAITEQKKCWELLAEKFDWFQTLRNNTQQHPTTCNRVRKRTQHVTCNMQQCWELLANNLASVCTGLKTRTTTRTRFSQYWVLLGHEQASFWRENVIAVVILLQVLANVEVAQTSYQTLEVLSFCDRERA